ncbi:MAG: cytochrome C oxidase subunit IV family protein [Verrucomicrobiales bacterium]|nr:cytochrome C oxidase subunit IV family protein [Verrucomicrobiales bacterium]
MSDPSAQTSHDDGHDDHHWNHHIKTYLKIGGILIFCTAFTWIAAYYIDLRDRHINIAFGLLIAVFKASLVALIFMHLKDERRLIYKVLVFTAIFVTGLVFLILYTQHDPIPHDKTKNLIYSK